VKHFLLEQEGRTYRRASLPHRQSMLNPFLVDASPGNPSPSSKRPTYVAFLPLLFYILATGFLLVMAMRVPSIVAAALFVTAAVVLLGAGVILGLSFWILPELPQ
jgi:hypothetical protein